MANLDSNINPIPKTLPEAAGKFFAGINAGIWEAEKNALIEAEKRLPPNVQESIKKHRDLIEENRKTIQANPTKSNILKRQNAITQQRIDKILSKNGFRDAYVNLKNEKRIEREVSRKRRREPDNVEVPSDADVFEASKAADEAIAGADELLKEPENELSTTTESVTAPPTAQAQEILPAPPTEIASANANKLAKALLDSLMSAAQSSIKLPPAPPTEAEEAEADMPAPFNVTSKPQPEPVIDIDNVPDSAVAETIVNALDESNDAVELPSQMAPTTTPVQVQGMQATTTISPGALANVIVNALKLASTTPPIQEPTPEQAQGTQEPTPEQAQGTQEPTPEQPQEPVPEQAQEPAPEPIQAQGTKSHAILHGALANVIVNALKLASTQAFATPTVQETVTPTVQETVTPTVQETVTPTVQETVTPTVQETVTPTVQETVTPTNASDKCSESPGFIALIQKYLEPIIGQFNPPETKPQKVFDKSQLPENMQQLLDDDNMKYIGRYRTDTKLGKNELSKEAHQQTTYLFWNTSTHDYTSHTLTDVVNNVLTEKQPASLSTTDALVAQLPLPPTRSPVLTTDELVSQLPLPPTTSPASSTNALVAQLPPNEKSALSV
jgi:hypothetical protein